MRVVKGWRVKGYLEHRGGKGGGEGRGEVRDDEGRRERREGLPRLMKV